MRKLGKKQLTLQLHGAAGRPARRRWPAIRCELAEDGRELVYTYDAKAASAPASPA